MSKKWHSGPPPSVGWWPASILGDSNMIRWWDGKRWSYPAIKSDGAKLAAHYAAIKEPQRAAIKWQERPENWPARSRT